MAMNSVYVIGIAGGSGSGKSTFAARLIQAFPDSVALVSCDNYYRAHDDIPLEERRLLNYDAPEALEFDLMVSHLQALKRGEAVDCPVYDFALHNRSDKVMRIDPKPVILVDGILILSDPALRETFDLRIYVEADADERILRRARRDMEVRGRKIDDIMEQYLNTVKPMHETYVEPSKKHADLILNGGMNPVALEIVAGRVRDFLENR
jgi:uridine kinase